MTDEIDPIGPFHALGRPELDVVVSRDCKGVGTYISDFCIGSG